MAKYDWAVNPVKLNRAKADVGNEDEAAVKARYIAIGGLVRGGSDDNDEEETETETPKKKGKKATE